MMFSFYLLGAVVLISAFMVVTRRNPMHSALWLLVTFFSLAGIYLLLSAEFVAAVQIIIYAGGVLVLYIFVIMLVDLSKEAALRAAFHKPRQVVFAAVFAFMVMAVVLWVGVSGIVPFSVEEPAAVSTTDTTRAFAAELFLTYLYPFEIASVLLLVAMIGSVILARRGMGPANSTGGNETG
ncbi:MAG: NADH-quinone oxidoreductase subunit J [Candidatus Hydrogenedentota bacterium]|nr:MAG: NADH-quinone oxidoreductase subunit J [Candidatus Hydrogenedentota bacterium]